MIQPNAVSQEIKNLKKAMSFHFDVIENEYKQKKKVSRREFVMRHLSTMNRHTMVEHPVGFHIDLIQSQPVLENKVCFELSHKGNCNGRGGGGEKKFVFAILDWPKKNQVRTAVYRALNGHEIIGERVNEFNWNAFIGMFGIEDVPENVVATQEAIDERIERARAQQQLRNL